jgi:NAD(P)-dependent dehydrogenase (short-subunit alcohol dehydrogenase family)
VTQSMEEEQQLKEGRVTFVTGGTRGIGLACALTLADQGYRVAVGSRTKPVDFDARLLWVECDVTNGSSVDAAFDSVETQLGPVLVLVANAGITNDKLVLRMTDDDFTQVIDANLTGAYRVAKRSVKGMMKARWGRIVLMSSIVGANGQAGQANYAASKAGLLGLGRSLAREFASRNVTVNLVAPGPIETDMFDAVDEATRSAITDVVPMRRIGQVDDVAAAVSFLVSEQANYITGVTIPVDGGLSMGT